MAGLFDCWTPPAGGEPLYSYSVITVDASPNLENIHDRYEQLTRKLVPLPFQSVNLINGLTVSGCLPSWMEKKK